ncbi:MAG: hypothetical protein NUW06_00365 [Candidatus Acetothermia bacterium]|jgi:hypothetical protein|nr:hypothetical protein [Candidatus Acetothermia bacterium]MDH7504967.1 hypothetical protein [Candidatus Acetothermia bacterium]
MKRKTMLLALFLLALAVAGGLLVLAGASTVGPPPTPPPPPEPSPPPPPVYPCAITPLPPEMDDGLRAKLPFEPDLLRAARSLDDGSWPLAYDGQYFKTFMNPEYSGIQALLRFDQLQRGAFIGGMKALVPFQIIDRGQCFPTLAAARSYDDGSFLMWMANAPILGVKLPPELLAIAKLPPGMLDLNWFMALIRVQISPNGKVDIKDIAALIFYPDARYHSPEEMLGAARAYDDGGILAPLRPETATD